MALIHCPKCGNDVSEKALFCSECGHPLNTRREPKRCPSFPSNLSIGDPVANFGGTAMLSGKYYSSEKGHPLFPDGEIAITMHTKGLHLYCTKKFKVVASLEIHNSQIESIRKIGDIDLLNKSMIEASVNGILRGPLSVLLESLSGMHHPMIVNGKCYIIINYWNAADKQLYSISIECYGSKSCLEFIRRYEREIGNYELA